MDKNVMGLAALAAYETFTLGILAACPLSHDQLCVTGREHCREEMHVERDTVANSTTTPAVLVAMSYASPNITPGTGTLRLST
jgi:hypothetical protein